MLDKLPSEIGLEIARLVTDRRDLKSLCEVSKKVWGTTMPVLYSGAFHIRMDESSMSFGNASSRVQDAKKHLQLTKEVVLRAPFHTRLIRRCPHDCYDRDGDGKLETTEQIFAHFWYPELNDPDNLEPESNDPGNSNPESNDPDNLEPESNDPGNSNPESNDPDSSDPESNDPESSDPESNDSDNAEPDLNDPDQAASELQRIYFSMSEKGVLENIEKDLRRFFRLLKDNSLRKFNWDLGTCIPEEWLGPSGYLTTKQTRIESLSLMTDVTCTGSKDHEGDDASEPPLLDLAQFKSLHTLSWKGPCSRDDFEALSECLNVNAHRLKNLTIDLIDESEAIKRYRSDSSRRVNIIEPNFFRDFFFGRDDDDETSLGHFPRLESLSLTEMCFECTYQDMPNAFNFRALRSLTLRNCSHVVDMLKNLAQDELTHLTFFELELDGTDDLSGDNGASFSNFFRGFQGLRSICLLLHGLEDWSNIARGIQHHNSTLKHLVLHERANDGGEDFDRGIPLYQDELNDVTCSPNIEFLGVSTFDFNDLLKYLELYITSQPTFKILHVRMSRDCQEVDFAQLDPSPLAEIPQPTTFVNLPDIPVDMAEFAQWAFDPADGLPELQILAYGDFSYDGRFAEHTILLCRDETLLERRTFRRVRDDDRELQDLLKENEEFLQACPVDGLLHTE